MFWVDVRIFLALVRSGSVRAAASAAGVSHATVARRVDAFETRLGIKLFDRLPIGYLLTPAGEDLLEVAEKVEDEFDAVQRRLAGVIRVTMIDVNATHLLMPDIVAFNELYPDIELEICMTHEPLDLRRRETDVAIRFVKTLPEYFIGRPLNRNEPLNRFRYAVRICPEPTHWGGLSGCTYSEGVSWGKFVPPSEGGLFAEVYSDATVCWPLLVQGVAQRLDKAGVKVQSPEIPLDGFLPPKG